ncbi:uncharacterized protein LOC135216514 [Macrobrachium nipponense]|uniref:uncharacterized protein LOC135216514 n=1 Tax=Macrobrachium nipponense TaxID=159736 RepID=UPI0030C85C9A
MDKEQNINLLLETVEDITGDWVLRLLNNREDHSEPRPVIHLRKWSKHGCSSKDALSGFSSSRATIKIECDLTHEDGSKQTAEETLVIKVLPTEGLMADFLIEEKMHHVEVGQYGRFLKTLQTWERKRRGPGNCAIMDELLPPHALAVSTDKHFTIVMTDLRCQGYQTMDFEIGLTEKQLLATAKKLGTYHGTGVSFKTVTGIILEETFHQCFHVGEGSHAFVKFAFPCFEQIDLTTSRAATVLTPLPPRSPSPSGDTAVFLYTPLCLPLISDLEETRLQMPRFKQDWSQNPEKTELLNKLKVYEDILVPFVMNSLKPKEPFAAPLHGDLQSSNIFFKEDSDGETVLLLLQLIDWATARYSQGTVDLVYLLNISVDTEIRRRATPRAIEMYFQAFNKALEDLGANISYQRTTFEADLKLAMQLIVIWSIMCNNVFSRSPKLKRRLDAIVTDVLTNPDIPLPVLQ